MLILRSKPSLDDFVRTFTPLYKETSLERNFSQRVNDIAERLLAFQPPSDPIQALVSFLRENDDFLGVALALTNLSQEKFLRILTAERFALDDYGSEWKIDKVLRKVRSDDAFAEQIARLFLEGRKNQTLAQQVADFYLAQIELPEDWRARIRDETLVKNVIRRKLAGEYNDAKGKAIEALVRSHLERFKTRYGIAFEKGQVPLVQKEVDFAIPSRDDPYVMIMSSYMETTGSGQTQRANEQNEMYQKIRGANVRYGKNRVLVNVLDGVGWLARRSDLRKLHSGCDYALSIKTLKQLESIIAHYVPPAFFINASPPSVKIQKRQGII